MIKTIKRTIENEIDLSTGDFQYLTGVEGLVQRHTTRLQTFKGEWHFDKSLGPAYIGPILGAKQVRVSEVKTLIISELMKVPGTKAITNLVVEEADTDRRIKITYAGISDDGEQFQEEITP